MNPATFIAGALLKGLVGANQVAIHEAKFHGQPPPFYLRVEEKVKARTAPARGVSSILNARSRNLQARRASYSFRNL